MLKALRCAVLLVLVGAAAVPSAAELPLLAPLSSGERLELPALDPAVPSPADVLGYPLGTRFTRYPEILAYLARLDAASERVATWEYGRTYLDRPLMLVAVSSPANIARLDEIRAERALLADPSRLEAEERGQLGERLPAVVWLAYGVHGNESSSSEAAMAAAYLLAAAQGEWAGLLERVVVLIDPLSNPDGRERYVGEFQERRGRVPQPDPAAAEHREPWPGGRTNHYLFDLNRDWAWATQRETRHRLAAVQQWEPQVYADFHEMQSGATYFFPPPAEPVNPEIEPRVLRWLEAFGRGNAAAFDRLGWLYFKAETYDLFYPGYADSYSSFRGAVGMTYEVGGGGRAGLALRLPDGTLLTLADRIARHLVASLATVRTAAGRSRELVADFAADRTAAALGPGRTYLWPADAPEGGALAETLARHGIRVRRLGRPEELPARPLVAAAGAGSEGAETAPRRFAAGTYAVSSAQPLGGLVRGLMEPETPMTEEFLDRQRRRVEEELDPAFYDVTAWALPLAFNVATWTSEQPPASAGPPLPAPAPQPPPRAAATAPGAAAAAPAATPEAAAADGEASVGWLLPPAGVAGYRAATALREAGVRFRLALDGFEAGGAAYPAGTLFVPRLGNPAGTARHLAPFAAGGLQVDGVRSSSTGGGLSLGSQRMASVGPVRAGVVAGEGVLPSSFGAVWHLLDQEIEMPVLRLDLPTLGTAELDDLDVLVLPGGYGYTAALAGDAGTALEAWVRAGGVLVAIGEAVDWVRERGLVELAEWEPGAPGAGGAAGAAGEAPGGLAGAASATGAVETAAPIDRALEVPGAVVATELRQGHPLGAGLPSPPPMLVIGSRPLLASGEPQTDVLTAAGEDPVLAGFAWPESRERIAGSLLAAVATSGRGKLVLLPQDPAFRGFWRGTMPLLLNAVLYGPYVL